MTATPPRLVRPAAGPRAAFLPGGGPWGRDAAPYPHPWVPPVTTLARR
ncbi:hypothetical protein [Streptomyces sp. RB17]|nr:hypothetical protein [Streptomyces sp. RB17]